MRPSRPTTPGRRVLRATAVASVAALLPGAAALTAGSAAAAPAVRVQAAPARAGSAGIGDPYYPTYGNGGYDVTNYDVRVGYTPRTDRLTGRTTVTATATQKPALVPPRPGAEGLVGHRRRRPREGRAHRSRARRHAAPHGGEGPRDARRGDLRRHPEHGLGARAEPLGAHEGRRRRRGRARDRRLVVPEQRPPARQGDLQHPRHGPEGRRGPEQRQEGLDEDGERPHHLALARVAADGQPTSPSSPPASSTSRPARPQAGCPRW
nr:hypothetical protein [Angustibacter aerolatus]